MCRVRHKPLASLRLRCGVMPQGRKGDCGVYRQVCTRDAILTFDPGLNFPEMVSSIVVYSLRDTSLCGKQFLVPC